MTWIVIIIGIVIVCCLMPSDSKKAKKTTETKHRKPELVIRMLNREGDLYQDEWHTYIAGLHYHASKSDVGGFCGYVANDPYNSYDKNAVAIYSKLKLLGYIPARELADFREWSDGEVMPCIGIIYVEDGQLRGRVKILKPCNMEFIQKGFSYYINWIKDTHGEKYLPKNITWVFSQDSIIK